MKKILLAILAISATCAIAAPSEADMMQKCEASGKTQAQCQAHMDKMQAKKAGHSSAAQ